MFTLTQQSCKSATKQQNKVAVMQLILLCSGVLKLAKVNKNNYLAPFWVAGTTIAIMGPVFLE
jgi:hypothetical protein